MNYNLGCRAPLTAALAQIQPTQITEATLMAVQQHMAQQAAFSQIPDAVKNVRFTID